MFSIASLILFQFASDIGEEANCHVVKRESLLGLPTSMVEVIKGGGLSNSLKISGSGVSVVFFGVLVINFFMFSGIIVHHRDLSCL